MLNINKLFREFKYDLKNFTKSNISSIILFILFIIIFSIISNYIYVNYIKKSLSNKVLNKEIIYSKNGNTNDKIDIYFFYTEWCPYCKKAKPEWDKFCSVMKNKYSESNYTIDYFEIDCDKNQTLANKFNVEGYPTIKIDYNNKIYMYDAKPDSENLLNFVESIL